MLKDFISNIRDKIRKNPKKFFIVIATIFIVSEIAIVIISIHHHTHDMKISIINIDNYIKSMPDTKKDEIYSTIYKAAKINSDYDITKLSTTTATIREKSYKESYDKYSQTFSGDFIVDIDSIQQTYHIYYEWSYDKETDKLLSASYSTTANCPTKTEAIYPFYMCRNLYSDNENQEYDYLSMLLPYNKTEENSISYTVNEIDYYYDSNKPYIRVIVETCGNEALLEKGVQDFKNYLKSYNLNPENYTIISQKSCDGGAL